MTTTPPMRGADVEAVLPALAVRDLVKTFPVRAGLFRRTVGQVQAVSGVTVSVDSGETLGIVGESGCGKSTLGRCILRLIEPDSGAVTLGSSDVLAMSKHELRDRAGQPPDRVPGSVRLAEPADDGAVDHRGADADPRGVGE